MTKKSAVKKTPAKAKPTAKKKSTGYLSVGRQTAYRLEFVEQAYKFCLLGATDEELAGFFKVHRHTIENWRAAHPEFLDAIARGRELADAAVAEKLYHRALGYSHPAVKIFNTEDGLVYADYTEHYAPDTQAASLWLRNRHPTKWRERTESVVIPGDPATLTDQQLEDIAAGRRKAPPGETPGKA